MRLEEKKGKNMGKVSKSDRMAEICTKLMSGFYIEPKKEALHYDVNEKTILRDMVEIERHMAEHGINGNLIYCQNEKAYYYQGENIEYKKSGGMQMI